MIHNLYIDLCTYLDGGGIGTGNKREPITFLTQWKLVGNSVIVESEGEVDNAMLPEGYQLCEYIESHGTEYLSLGKDGLFTYEFRAQNLGDDSVKMIIGNGSGAAKYLAFRNGKWSLSSSVITEADANIPADVRVTFATDGATANIGSETLTIAGTNSVGYFYFFTYTPQNTTYNSSARLWYLKAYNGNTLVHDWKPCLDAAGVPCMYDAIAKTTLYNRGTGTFGYKLAEKPKVIMSCGDLGDDGKYHVLIKADSRVIDIPLDEPLRKVGDVGDTIEFASDEANTAKVTRNIGSVDMGSLIWSYREDLNGCFQSRISSKKFGRTNILAQLYSVADVTTASLLKNMQIIAHSSQVYIYAKNILYTDAEEFKKSLFGVEIIYERNTPTTSYISVPSIPLAKAYSSANQVPYSEFSYENPNALYIDGEPMLDESSNEIVMKIGRKTFNEL